MTTKVLEHVKDKNIKEGVHVYVQAGLAKNHCATNCHDSYCSLNKPNHSSHFEVYIGNMVNERRLI